MPSTFLGHLPSEMEASLESELLHLENELKSAREVRLGERAIVRRKLNAINSVTHRLPFETLSLIFLYAIAPPPRPSPLDKWAARESHGGTMAEIFFSVTLTAVCSRWRSVAISSPNLWTRFEFSVTTWALYPPPFHLFSLYLRNSKHLPIHLFLSFVTRPRTDKLFHPSFDRDLISNSARIHTLSLYNPPLRWLEQLGKLLFIVDLSVDWPAGIQSTKYAKDHIQLHHCHALSRLSLRNVVASDNGGRLLYQMPASLKILDLSNMPIDICIKVMLRCPNLVEAYAHDPKDSGEDTALAEIQETWFSDPVIFNCLTILLWPFNDSKWSDAFLQQIKTPQLHTLKMTHDILELQVRAASGDAAFIEQLPGTLKTLELEGFWAIHMDTLGRLVNAQSSVEHLMLSRCLLGMYVCIFDALSEFDGTAKPKYLPQLKSLLIKGCFGFESEEIDEFRAWSIELIIDALERRLGQGDSFHLEFSNLAIDWTPRAQARLRGLGLHGRGVDLEVVENGEQVAWLQSI